MKNSHNEDKESLQQEKILTTEENSDNKRNFLQQGKLPATGESSRHRQKFSQYKKTLTTGEKSKIGSNTHVISLYSQGHLHSYGTPSLSIRNYS